MWCSALQTAQYSANGINNATKYNVNQGIMQLINNFKDRQGYLNTI